LSDMSNLSSSVEIRDNPRMLLPRYSLRTTLILMTVCAAFFFVVGMAYRGQAWAVVVSVAIVGALVALLSQAGFYVLLSLLSRLFGTEQTSARTSHGGVQANADEQTPLQVGRLPNDA